MLKMNRRIVLCMFLIGLVAACGGGTTTEEEAGDETGGEGVATSENALAVAYPDDLAVTSPLVGGASTVASISKAEGGEQPFKPQNFIDKKEEMGNLLVAANPADIHIEIDFTKTAPTVGCYGPVLILGLDGGTGHPDDSDFDLQNFSLPPFDLGIWAETEDDEACIAAQVNALMADIENILNTGLKGAAAALGAANIEGVDLPAAGETDNITEEVTEAFAGGDMPMTPEVVTIAREAEDNTEGFPVYVTEMTADIEGGAEGPSSFEATLTHIPEVDVDAVTSNINADVTTLEDSTYCGRMRQKVNFEEAAMGMDCPAGGQTECISISYCKDSETSMTYHVRRAKFCGQDADCFDANNDVDPMKDWQHDFFYIVAQVNPEDGSGSFAQAWQAGFGDGNTRVFNVTVTVGADGTGCGYYGYGPEVQSTSGVGEISGMICNWTAPGAGPMGNKTIADKAQKQCFTLNSTTGLYESDSDDLAITYAPTNSCDKAAGTFAYGLQQGPPWDVPAATAVNDNLIDIADVVFTMPALPVVVE